MSKIYKLWLFGNFPWHYSENIYDVFVIIYGF